MEFDKTAADYDRLVRLLLAATLAFVAVSSLRRGRRLVGVLAGVGAVGLGYTAAVKSPDSSEAEMSQTEIASEAAEESGGLRCFICSEPIVVGQSRRPNADNHIVHEGCL